MVRGGTIERATRAPLHALLTREETAMLDNFRKRDSTRAAPVQSQSPYGRMQEALSPAPAGAETPKAALPKTDPPRAEAAAQMPANKAEESVSKLIVGPDIKLKGAEITDCNTLVVEGRVEAAMESRVLQIADIGAFVGKAGVDTAEIRGRFDGELTVRKQLVIRATGHVSGKIRYGKLSIEEGGELSGDIGAIGPSAAAADGFPALAVKTGAVLR
jgi:cytoskeletal protein CcmA (bactofilin family)